MPMLYNMIRYTLVTCVDMIGLFNMLKESLNGCPHTVQTILDVRQNSKHRGCVGPLVVHKWDRVHACTAELKCRGAPTRTCGCARMDACVRAHAHTHTHMLADTCMHAPLAHVPVTTPMIAYMAHCIRVARLP